MLFRLEGQMEIVNPPDMRPEGLYRTEEFSVEVAADSPEEAQQRAIWKLKTERRLDSPRNFSFKTVQPASYTEFGELGQFVFEELLRRWLKDNHHLRRFGYPPDVLARPESIGPSQSGGSPAIRYITPDTGRFLWDPQLDFPRRIVPLLMQVVKTKAEAEIAIDLVFERIDVVEGKEGDGDHHSMTYGQDVITVYCIYVNLALGLARNVQELRRLIDERKAKA